MARRQAPFEDLLEIGSKLPWKVAVMSAGGAFVVFHFLALSTSTPAGATTLSGLRNAVGHQIVHMIATFAQYLLPAGLLMGATLGFVKQSQDKSLVSSARTNPKAISAMSWREFERLVGEAFRQRGFTVTGFGGSGPDGGVDLALMKNGERFLVQCKHWRKDQVGVTGGAGIERGHGGHERPGGLCGDRWSVHARGTGVCERDEDRAHGWGCAGNVDRVCVVAGASVGGEGYASIGPGMSAMRVRDGRTRSQEG